MKVVYFVRHAKSSWEDSRLKDFDRPLNKRGFRDAPFMGKLVHAKGAKPDRLISSPAVRALTTARFFAEAMAIEEAALQLEQSIYEAFADELMRIVQSLNNEWQEVMLFGHNPSLTTLANRFSASPISNVPTCGVFRVEAEVDDWKAFTASTASLTEFHYPKQYFS